MSSRIITASELLQAPTGFDWSSVAETTGANSTLDIIEQSNIIDRASAWVSTYLYGMYGRVDATSDTETARVGNNSTKAFVDNQGWLWFRTSYHPVLTVTSMAWAYASAGFGTLTYNSLTAANCLIYGEGFRLNRIADISQDWRYQGGPLMVKTTYVNGWPNATLSSSASSSASTVSLTVDTTVGMTAVAGAIGNVLTIYDGVVTENVTVSSVTNATQVVVTSMAYNHTPTGINPIGISAIPSDVKLATILACLHFARERGTDAVEMGTQSLRRTSGGGGDSLAEAEYILDPYRRVI